MAAGAISPTSDSMTAALSLSFAYIHLRRSCGIHPGMFIRHDQASFQTSLDMIVAFASAGGSHPASDIGKCLAVLLQVVEAQPLHDLWPLPPANQMLDLLARAVTVSAVLQDVQELPEWAGTYIHVLLQPSYAVIVWQASHLYDQRVCCWVRSIVKPVAGAGGPQSGTQLRHRRLGARQSIDSIHADAAGTSRRPLRDWRHRARQPTCRGAAAAGCSCSVLLASLAAVVIHNLCRAAVSLPKPVDGFPWAPGGTPAQWRLCCCFCCCASRWLHT